MGYCIYTDASFVWTIAPGWEGYHELRINEGKQRTKSKPKSRQYSFGIIDMIPLRLFPSTPKDRQRNVWDVTTRLSSASSLAADVHPSDELLHVTLVPHEQISAGIVGRLTGLLGQL